MRNGVLLSLCIFLPGIVFSQVGINTDNPNLRAVLDLQSPTNDQGLLVPRLGTLQRTAQSFTSRMTEAENGLLIFDTDEKLFYYWMHPSWKVLGAETGGTIWRSGEGNPSAEVGKDGRWGDKVFEIDNYDNNVNVFRGRANLNGDPELVSGTYFYVLDLPGRESMRGFIVVRN